MKYFLFLIFTFNYIFAQNYLYQKDIGSFQSANSFSLSGLNYFYVVDKTDNEVIKIDTLGKTDKSIGGFGSDNYSFDSPVDIFSTALNVYVTDKNNHRLLIYDKDLNYISELDGNNVYNNSSSENISFNYPINSIVSTQGDMFILDSDNKRILKFDSRGEFLISFGDYNSGSFSLSKPGKIAFLGNSMIAVLDKGRIVLFDLFGSGLNILKLDLKIKDIHSCENGILMNTNDKVYRAGLEENKLTIKEIVFERTFLNGEIVEALMSKDNLYILTRKSISVFKNKKG